MITKKCKRCKELEKHTDKCHICRKCKKDEDKIRRDSNKRVPSNLICPYCLKTFVSARSNVNGCSINCNKRLVNNGGKAKKNINIPWTDIDKDSLLDRIKLTGSVVKCQKVFYPSRSVDALYKMSRRIEKDSK